METLEKTSLSEKIISGLKKAAIELEEFRLQAALGKSEAKAAYEEANKKFSNYVHEAKLRVNKVKGMVKEKSSLLQAAFETLQVQLALGKAESNEMFEAQLKKIIRALKDIEVLIRKNKTVDLYYAELQMEIEKFRIKLDILKLQYELKKTGVHEEFEEKKRNFLKDIYEIKKRLLDKEYKVEAKWEHFHDEISHAYFHFKKAFVNSP